MRIRILDHCNIETTDLEATMRFYTILGLTSGERPNVSVPGAWLYADGRPVLHVNAVEVPASGETGKLHHVAFNVGGYQETCAALDAGGLAYDVLDLPELDGRVLIYVVDPNGVRIELNSIKP